jgi:hypothetical protein
MQRYYEEHPEEFQKFVESLPLISHQAVVGEQPPAGQTPPSAGTWTSLTNPSGQNLSNPILLTDGTVIAHVSQTTRWYKFTPSNTGNYVNGTWSAIASTASTYGPRFFGSGVLPDGRVVIEGGEYNLSGGRTTQGAIYDPTTNVWTPVAPPSGWGTISDAAGVILPNGTYMQTSCCDSPPHAALLNPSTLTWTATGSGKFDVYDEESIALLHDNTLLAVDAYVFAGCGTGSERYTPSTGLWTSAGSTVVQQSDCNGNGSFEVGPLVMRPDGTAVSFSGRTSAPAPQTAIFKVATNSWSAGPIHPSVNNVPYTMADAPAAVLPNGNVLVAMSPSNWPASNTFPLPTHFFELNANNTFTQVPDKVDAASFNSYQQNFILLPTGEVMSFSIDGPTVQIYTPTGAFSNAWRPVVSSVPTSLAPGQTFTISGTQLNGLTEGTYYGDDTNASTNFPLVRITNNASGHVSYARTFNHSSRSIAPDAASSTSVTLPATIETGASILEVVANGIPSLPVNIVVSSPSGATLTTPPPGSTISGTVTFGWTTGAGASQYWLSVGTTGVGSANIYSNSAGTSLSASVAGVPDSGTIYVRLWTLLTTGWTFNDYTYAGGSVAAAITSPTPNTTLAGPMVTFGWNTGVGISQYWLSVGTTGVGSVDIYSSSTGTTLSATVNNVPTSGTIYVRLWSLAPSGWRFRDYTYKGGTVQKAVMTTPKPASTLNGSSETFGWTAGNGANQYWLYVGTTGAGSSNVYNQSAGTALSRAVSGLPISGTLYVRLWSLLPAGWDFNDYTYTGGQVGTMSTPAPGTILNGAAATFTWSPGTTVSDYWLYVGSTGAGSLNIYASNAGTALSATVNGIPTSGTVYVRLWSLVSGTWGFNDYVYTGGSAAGMTTPAPGSTLGGSTVTFAWVAGTGASQYFLYAGTTGTGSSDLYASSEGSALSASVSGLPTSGTIYVRLWTLVGSTWSANDYTYSGSGPAAIKAPTPGSTLSGSSVTFDWDAGNAVTQYWLFVGTTGAGSANIYNSSTGTTRSATVSTMPTSGTVYVRLWSLLPAGWTAIDYTYTGGP